MSPDALSVDPRVLSPMAVGVWRGDFSDPGGRGGGLLISSKGICVAEEWFLLSEDLDFPSLPSALVLAARERLLRVLCELVKWSAEM